MLGAYLRQNSWMRLGGSAAVAQATLVAVAFAALTHAYVISDFSVLNVAQNSHSAKPLLYKISGVWGNHEGSMLLWLLILSGFGAALALLGGDIPLTLKSRTLAVQGLLGTGFLLFVLLSSNPFWRIFPPPFEGNGLNPLLQDPGLAFHPPFLYLGYVGFSLALSFAIAGLIERKVDRLWAKSLWPWVLLPWIFLTAGIALGSRWAYYTLGWGGWWFWDPVENASLMPWLTATALLHSLIVLERRATLKSWSVLLAIITFTLALVGTFLVRSGVIVSVHTFAVDPERGVFILGLLGVIIAPALALYAVRARRLTGNAFFAPLSRESALIVNNLLLLTAGAIVFIGTTYPLLLEAIGAGSVAVGFPYYQATFVPLMAVAVAIMGVAPMLAWKRADMAWVMSKIRLAALVGLAGAGSTLGWHLVVNPPAADSLSVAPWTEIPWTGAVGIALASWILAATLTSIAERIALGRTTLRTSVQRLRHLRLSVWGTTLAHGGVALAILGMTGSESWDSESILALRPGSEVTISDYRIVFESVRPYQGQNYQADQGTFAIWRELQELALLQPQLRYFPLAQQSIPYPALYTSGFDDLMIVLGGSDDQGRWTVRIFHHPMIALLWIGSGAVVLGGLASLADRLVGRFSRRPRE